MLLLLQEFGVQNAETVRKVVKKHRKGLGGRLEATEAIKNVAAGEFKGDQSELMHIISETEGLYVACFLHSGSAKERRKTAMKILTFNGGSTSSLQNFESSTFGWAFGAATVIGVSSQAHW